MDTNINIRVNKDLFFSLLEEVIDKTKNKKNKVVAYYDLLGKAQEKYVSPNISRYYVKVIHIGQCQITISDLASSWNWHRKTVRDYLNELENLHTISREKHPRYEILTFWEGEKSNEEDAEAQRSVKEKWLDILKQWECGHLQSEEAGKKLSDLLLTEGKDFDSLEKANVMNRVDNSLDPFPSLYHEYIDLICVSALKKALRLNGDMTDTDSQKFFNCLKNDCNKNWGDFLTILSEVAFLFTNEDSSIDDDPDLWNQNTLALLNPFRAVLGNITNQQTINDYM